MVPWTCILKSGVAIYIIRLVSWSMMLKPFKFEKVNLIIQEPRPSQMKYTAPIFNIHVQGTRRNHCAKSQGQRVDGFLYKMPKAEGRKS